MLEKMERMADNVSYLVWGMCKTPAPPHVRTLFIAGSAVMTQWKPIVKAYQKCSSGTVLPSLLCRSDRSTLYSARELASHAVDDGI